MPLRVALFAAALFGASPIRAAEFDVVVYGGTPGGIASALSAARLGRSVALVEYHEHVGGMAASGLGKSDIENRALIGGLFKEFVQRVHTHYVKTYGDDSENVKLCHDGYYYEPSIAEAVFKAMLGEHRNLTVMKGWRLKSARVKDHRLLSVEVTNRRHAETRTLSGRVFIDATYEGDLYAAAGAKFRLGREARAEHNEPHAGVVYFDYQNRKILDGTTGAADDRLPAYTYRLCLTTDPKNAQPLTKPPAEYDRRHYLGYFEDLKAGRLAGPKVLKPGRGYNQAHFDTLVRALSVTDIPNGKTDVNINPRPLGFPFCEENRGYVEGDEKARQQICERHRQLVLGLLWFLQQDEEVPAAHRKLAGQYHLPRDEFTDNGHFPFQLYVREARRLVGAYTLTEHDITGDGRDRTPRRHADSIAVGEFPIDSFPCRKRQPGDTLVLEGYLGMLDHITRPYEIPYRILIPKTIDGLIVPVAASTTHVAFSSIRMEPTWMALGQAAGVAAHLAIQHDIPPRRVSIPELQRTLTRQGQVLQHTTHPDPVKHPDSPLMLTGPWVPENPQEIEFDKLPRVPSQHVVVSSVRAPGSSLTELDHQNGGVNQHNYLAHHKGKFWAMWSDGPGVEDRAGQRVKFATSAEGLNWSKPDYLTPLPRDCGPDSIHYNRRSRQGFRYIARGFWQRDGELLALAALDEAAEFFGRSLELHAFRWKGADGPWEPAGIVFKDAINNFPPKRLRTGEWLMSRRKHDYRETGAHFLVGGEKSIDRWESFPVLGSNSKLKAEEPEWWVLPDKKNLVALFRDNNGSGFLYRAFSTDDGRSWSEPVRTNFPDATSKISGLRLGDGRYALVSNARPRKRDPLVLSISDDGMVFSRMLYLVGDRWVDYPHIMEHDGHLYIAFAGGKQSVELLKVSLKELDKVKMPETPLQGPPLPKPAPKPRKP